MSCPQPSTTNKPQSRPRTKRVMVEIPATMASSPGPNNARNRARKQKQKANRALGMENQCATVMTAQPLKSNSNVMSFQNSSDIARISGNDFLSMGDETTGTSIVTGKVLLNRVISARSFLRAGLVSRAFQKYKFLKLRFDIISGFNGVTNGSYVAAFNFDPTDEVPDLLTPLGKSQWATSQAVVMTAGASASITLCLPANALSKWLYTSDASDARDSALGRLVIIATSSFGSVNEGGSINVTASWTIQFSGASYELEPANAIEAVYPIIIRSGHQGLWGLKAGDVGTGGTDSTDKPSEMFPGIKLGQLYKLPVPFVYTAAGNVTYQFQYVEATATDTLLPREVKTSENYKDDFTHNRPVLEEGTRLIPVL